MKERIEQLEQEIKELKLELAKRDRELLRFYQQVGFDSVAPVTAKMNILNYE
jgi:uncharacterized protein (UPF0335 family)